MPLKLPDVWSPVINWLYQNSPAAVAAIAVAIVRMAYEGSHKYSETATEALMSGIIAYIAIAWMSYAGMAPDSVGWIGGVVGYLGTKKVDRIAKVLSEKKGGTNG